MVKTAKAKNADYAGACKDPFGNFKLVETLNIASVEQGFMTRITDKLSRINSLTKNTAQVKDESIQDTLLDLANYSILMDLYLNHNNQTNEKEV